MSPEDVFYGSLSLYFLYVIIVFSLYFETPARIYSTGLLVKYYIIGVRDITWEAAREGRLGYSVWRASIIIDIALSHFD